MLRDDVAGAASFAERRRVAAAGVRPVRRGGAARGDAGAGRPAQGPRLPPAGLAVAGAARRRADRRRLEPRAQGRLAPRDDRAVRGGGRTSSGRAPSARRSGWPTTSATPWSSPGRRRRGLRTGRRPSILPAERAARSSYARRASVSALPSTRSSASRRAKPSRTTVGTAAPSFVRGAIRRGTKTSKRGDRNAATIASATSGGSMCARSAPAPCPPTARCSRRPASRT